MSGLYIHIPFCRQKCHYCDFASFACKEDLIDSYLCSIDTEASFFPHQSFDTLYIGGGTPSILSVNQMDVLCEIINRRFAPINTFAESTIEANPESLSLEKLKLLKQRGINRLSLGLQSMNDDVLKYIGRVHDTKTFLSVYEQARKAGFENISIDLIAGLPNQSEEDFLQGLKKVLDLVITACPPTGHNNPSSEPALTQASAKPAQPGNPQPPQLACGNTSATCPTRGSSFTANFLETTNNTPAKTNAVAPNTITATKIVFMIKFMIYEL